LDGQRVGTVKPGPLGVNICRFHCGHTLLTPGTSTMWLPGFRPDESLVAPGKHSHDSGRRGSPDAPPDGHL